MSNAREFLLVNEVNPMLKSILLEPPAWTRLEPQSFSGDPEPGLEARVHDPLWLLARQWQLAEFEGEDVGTPLIVRVKTQEAPVTAWQPGDPASQRPARALVPGVPLDPLVENEPPAEVGLRQRAEAGAYLVELLGDEGFDGRAGLVAACPLPVTENAAEVSASFRLLARGAPDGVRAAEQLEAGNPAWLEGAPEAARAAAARWLQWFRAGVQAPPREVGDDSWIPERLEYRFSLRVGSGEKQRVLRAPLHEGGEIDWFTFEVDSAAQLSLDDESERAVVESELHVMATPLRFAGMPSDRYWQFEDGQVNLGNLDAQPHDLARLCVAEFGMIYGNDWLVVPVNVPAGSLTVITEVRYTDTFGEETAIARAADANLAGGFGMFEMSVRGGGGRTVPGLLVAPTALGALEGRALEEVIFVRDEMANLAWAVERVVQNRSGDPRSRRDEEHPINQAEEMVSEAELQYLLETRVPPYWIPFVPIATGVGTIALRKGRVGETDASLGMLLRATPLTIRDEEIPRAGIQVRRVPSLARAANGQYLRWITRRARVGRGEGSSGLAYDATLSPRPS